MSNESERFGWTREYNRHMAEVVLEHWSERLDIAYRFARAGGDWRFAEQIAKEARNEERNGY